MLTIAGGIIIAVVVLFVLLIALGIWAENDFKGCGCILWPIGLLIVAAVVFGVWVFLGEVNNGREDVVFGVVLLVVCGWIYRLAIRHDEWAKREQRIWEWEQRQTPGD